jgi:hypothetical protein
MGVIQRRLTGESVYQGIIANGLQPLREEFYDYGGDGKPVAACIIGMAAYNLHAAADNDYATNFRANITDQLNNFTVPSHSRWRVPYNEGIGDTIIHWTDKLAETGKQEDANGGYLLSWDECIAMAKELLTPVWNTEFIVDAYEFGV